MGLVIIILIAVVFYFAVIKPKSNSEAGGPGGNGTQQPTHPTVGVNLCPADALINSPYYASNQVAFDLIWYNGKQPQYKIDWLLESLKLGHEIESGGYYITQSIEKDLPYFCETEEEYDRFFKSESPVLRGDIDAMMDLAFYYIPSYKNHPSKLKYWKEQILNKATEGNVEAQGALCGGYANAVFGPELRKQYIAMYQEEIIHRSELGDPYAQLARGKYIEKYRSREAIEWLQKAANQGLSDAWFNLAKQYGAFISLDDDGNIRKEPLSSAEEESIRKSIAACYANGAQADNGVMAARCQYMTGSYYEDGDSIFPRDFDKARYWYKKAADYGDESAARSLQYLTEHPYGYTG